ncbi:hypothetical protein HF324_30535 [Chitinophaga oryzae]|uniref:AAA+ ATPase domain-containing protein n=1 Tax=Chitinophaga oryzae TaxID=2725414 RepID=A0ABX6LPZ7_9BACT|nr:hypothetical protein [Chitinophaga oryzae]QJB41949.1 hypothetical protein HF324_30535 [Chitinophaga oryzae]
MSILLYNPDKKDKAAFLDEFVIRNRIFDHMFWEIQTDKMIVPEQHYMIVGPRGAGKTSLLLRLRYAVEDDPVLSKRVIPVMFGEEQYNIGELGNLWERIAEYLEDYYGFDGITGEIEKYIYRDDYEEASFRILIKYLDQRKQNRIMLLIDNIGQLFDKFEINEIRRLREILQTWPHIRLVAGSPVILHYIVDYDQPLHEFFKIIRLNSLTDEEAVTLIRKLAVVYHEEEKIERILAKMPERVSTLNTLSGGIPRTIVLLFKVFVDNEHGNALSDLERILDAVTPLYKHRMDDLPPQQQKIIDAVALHWEPIEVKDLTKAVRLESKVISAQLRQLEKNQVVEKYRTKTKNHQYQLKERFFNIWYLMRYGRKMDRNKVIWLVKFLEAWCEKGEIEKRIKDYIKKAKKGEMNENALEIYALTYSFFESIKTETKLQLKDSVPSHLSKNIVIKDDDLFDVLDKAIKKGNGKRAFALLKNINFAKEQNRDRILHCFIQLDLALLQAWASVLINVEEKEYDENLLYLNSVVALILALRGISVLVITDEKQHLSIIMKHFADFLETSFHRITQTGQRMIIVLIQLLLSGNYWSIVMDFFNEKKSLKKKMPYLFELSQYYIALHNNEERRIHTISARLDQTIGRERMDAFIKETEEVKLAWEK